MSWFADKMARMMPLFVRGKRYMGRDLEGNKFYELPSKTSPRPKRVVEYRRMTEMAEYTSGKHRLPVQWSTWLSHTRADPPTLAELESDASRRQNLQPLIAAIEARERAERIRQGYLVEPDPSTASRPRLPPSRETIHRYLPAGPSFAPSTPPSPRASVPPPPLASVVSPSTTPSSPPSSQATPEAEAATAPPSSHARSEVPTLPPSRARQDDHAVASGSREDALSQSSSASWSLSSSSPALSRLGPVREEQPSYPVPTPSHPDLAPPGKPVDPRLHSSREDLRKLAEEDTKRRMAESGVAQEASGTGPTASSPIPPSPPSGGLQPRRRGPR